MSWFKWCFYCKGKENLLKTSIPIYTGYQNYHYHMDCLHEVLESPMKHKKFIDMALEIATCLDDERIVRECKEAKAKELLDKIKSSTEK